MRVPLKNPGCGKHSACLSTVNFIQSGVALRLPPHSKPLARRFGVRWQSPQGCDTALAGSPRGPGIREKLLYRKGRNLLRLLPKSRATPSELPFLCSYRFPRVAVGKPPLPWAVVENPCGVRREPKSYLIGHKVELGPPLVSTSTG